MKQALQVSYAFITPLALMIYVVLNGYPSLIDGITFIFIYFLFLFLIVKDDIK